jgi:hypothetical protein
MRACQKFLLLAAVVLTPSVVIADDSDEFMAIEKIKLLGGEVKRADNLPDGPVTEVWFNPDCRFNDKHLRLLKSFNSLTTLDLTNANITDDGMEEIGGLKNLQELCLINSAVTGDGLKELSDLPRLTTLILMYGITDDGLKEVSNLTNLETLTVFSTKITDDGLKEIHRLKNLTTLHLSSRQISDAGMKEISRLRYLTKLSLRFVPMTDEGLNELLKLRFLTHLDISNTLVTDAGLKELSQFKSLIDLNITGLIITEIGLKELGNVKTLMTLRAHLPQGPRGFAESGINELRKSLPELEFAGGSFPELRIGSREFQLLVQDNWWGERQVDQRFPKIRLSSPKNIFADRGNALLTR